MCYPLGMSLVRIAILATATIAIIYYGIEGTHTVLAGLLVLIGAVAISIWFASNVWKRR